MNSRQERVQVLYEISLAVGRGSDLTETAREALSAYLRKLNCSAGAVLARRNGPDGEAQYEPVAAIPAQPTVHDGYQHALSWLRDTKAPALPELLTIDDSTAAYLMELPGFGVLVLVTPGPIIDDDTVGALGALNQKLADACRAEQIQRELRAQRDRFEAVVETVPEPMIHVVTQDGDSVVRDVNSAFETTFGYERHEARGSELDELLANGENGRYRATEEHEEDERAADGSSTDAGRAGEEEVVDGGQGETASRGTRSAGDERSALGSRGAATAVDTPQNPDTSWVRNETPVKREVKRQTPNGERVFRLRTVPVPSPDNGHEQFGLYIDITDQRRRQRTLERLYQTVQEFFDAPDSETVCRRAVKAAAEVLDFSTCGVHLYDRETEGLEPVATTGVSDAFDEETDAPTYTDPDTMVWEAYRTGETVVIANTETFAGQLPDEDTPVRSALVLPLGNHGVFITSSQTPNAFDESDQYFGKLLGRMLQTALDRTMREQSLRSVQSATRSLVTASDAEAIAESLVTRAAETISAPYVGVWRHEPGEQLLRPVAQTAAAAELFGRAPTFGPGDSIAWEVFREGEARLVNHVAAAEAAYDRDSPMQSEIIVPLGSYGVLTTGSKLANDFSQEEFELLQALATSAESALQIVGKQRELDVLDEVLARILRHNVRNDLNVIRGRAKIIVNTGPPDCVDHAESIVKTADKILTTAANATEIREVVDRRDEYRTMRVDDVVRSAVSEVREMYTGAIVAVAELPSMELAVHPHFKYAVRHAVENGIEHDDSDEPRVEVRAAVLDNGAVIEVKDDGPGIPESEIEPLVAGEETRLVHGSGAGLWILDRVVQYSGGTVEFDTDSDGTVVRLIVNQTALPQ